MRKLPLIGLGWSDTFESSCVDRAVQDDVEFACRHLKMIGLDWIGLL